MATRHGRSSQLSPARLLISQCLPVCSSQLQVFRNLRLMWGVHDAEYMLSLAGSQALRQLNSPGKSGGWGHLRCCFQLSAVQGCVQCTVPQTRCIADNVCQLRDYPTRPALFSTTYGQVHVS
jgi:hypothetical protein